jgi:DNA-binding NarL/FixJ family response regulator
LKLFRQELKAARHVKQSDCERVSGVDGKTSPRAHTHYFPRAAAALRLLAAGRTVYDIAEEFGIPPRTIRRWRNKYDLPDE